MLNSLTERFSLSINAMFITILEVLMDRTETKSVKLKFYVDYINANNLSVFQKLEWPIARTTKKPNQTLFQLENKTNKIYFQNTRTPDSDWSQTNHIGRKSSTATISWKSYNMFYQPPHPDHRPPVKIDINKTYLYTGKLGTANGHGHNQG